MGFKNMHVAKLGQSCFLIVSQKETVKELSLSTKKVSKQESKLRSNRNHKKTSGISVDGFEIPCSWKDERYWPSKSSGVCFWF